ncbi:hypothetical protein FSP39_001479 [Pinctada imbricata]|uniref:JmjC domain-containing protein n=1 Tax=Pinctada imbricata TaxID=66713 RepID=A0AA88Y2V2_PINIB|nr:hypothetical protein FSP39_001479 [Pinctada imbricata]
MSRNNYAKPPRVKMLRIADSQMNTELVTPCRLIGVFLVSTTMVVMMSLSVYDGDQQQWKEDTTNNVNFTNKPYKFDFKAAMRMREENLEIYNRPNHKWIVERRSKLSIEEFWDIYDGKWPVIVTDIVKDWAAINWTKNYLLRKYGKQKVMYRSIQDAKQEIVSGHFSQLDKFVDTLSLSSPKQWNYMEDELFLLFNPSLKAQIGFNRFAEENFFDLFPYEIRPWEACFFWGAQHSRSLLHIDPYNWTGTSAVISGKKLWKLYPPGQDKYLHVVNNVNCGFPLECIKYNSPVDTFDFDSRTYPGFTRAQYIQTELLPGEMLIIPTGWFHQAYNEEETISISGQIMNRNNYLVILEEIIKAKNVKRRKLPQQFDTLLPPEQVPSHL